MSGHRLFGMQDRVDNFRSDLHALRYLCCPDDHAIIYDLHACQLPRPTSPLPAHQTYQASSILCRIALV